MCYVTSLATALSFPTIFCQVFQFIKTQVEMQYRTYCQIVNIQLPDVAESFGDDYLRTVPLPLANVSSEERIEPVHSKARERWGYLKSWKIIPILQNIQANG